MCDRATKDEILVLLEKAKTLMANGDWDFVPRRKNMQALTRIGLTITDAKEELLELKVNEYYKGPKRDFDRPGEIWEFKKNISGTIFYIKIKIVVENNREILKCIGFHDDEF